MTDEPIWLSAEWPIERGRRVRVTIETCRGREVVNIRKWCIDRDGSELRPSREKGISLAIEDIELLAAAVNALLAEARRCGLVPPSDVGTTS